MPRAQYREDRRSLLHICLSPLFLTKVLLCVTASGVYLTCSVLGVWPRFCEHHSWAYVNNFGGLTSLFILECAVLITRITFEDCNWVFYAANYLIHGLYFLISGIVYLIQVLVGCPDGVKLWPEQGNTFPLPIYNLSLVETIMEGMIFGIGVLCLILSLVYVLKRQKVAK